MGDNEFFCIGISWGNEGAVMAYVDKNGASQTILNSETETVTPSVVFWEQDEYGNIYAIRGGDAVPYTLIRPKQTIKAVRRDLGTDKKIEIYGKIFMPEEISSIILGKIKEDAEQHFQREVTHSIITVPTYFGDVEKDAIKLAAVLAGWDENNVKIIYEPVAAVYGFFNDQFLSGEEIKPGEKFFILQLDADDFDCIVIEYNTDNKQKHPFIIVKSWGTSLIGGNAFSEKVFLWIANEYQNNADKDIKDDVYDTNQVMKAVRKAIDSLSKRKKRKIIVDLKPPLIVELTREKFHELCVELFDQVEETIDYTLETPHQNSLNSIHPSLIDTVIMVGNPSRIWGIKELVEKKFPNAEIFQNYEEVIMAHGAAIYGLLHFVNLDTEMRGISEKLENKLFLNIS